jgi:arylsulfatase A-like enzyme
MHLPAEQRAAGARALREYYRYTDALIGQLVANYGSSDLVMVVSDHGFEAGVRMKYLTGIHETEKAIDGVIFARGRDIQRGRGVGPMSIRDVTPSVLAWLGLPVAKDMDGKVAKFVETPRKPRIATYDTQPVPHVTSVSSGAEQEMLERLRQLGYFEEK